MVTRRSDTEVTQEFWQGVDTVSLAASQIPARIIRREHQFGAKQNDEHPSESLSRAKCQPGDSLV